VLAGQKQDIKNFGSVENRPLAMASGTFGLILAASRNVDTTNNAIQYWRHMPPDAQKLETLGDQYRLP
jgi:hypothetical protein